MNMMPKARQLTNKELYAKTSSPTEWEGDSVVERNKVDEGS